jgi:predicted ATPase
MITRIKINGFKSLLKTDLYFGPFTCIAGANAAGKSNFFDALVFLSNLSDKTIVEAAKSVRSESQKHSNVKDIFFKSGKEYLDEMSFEIDMIIPKSGEDDLGQQANAIITTLTYKLVLRLNSNNSENEPIEIIKEELSAVSLGAAKKSIFFPHKNDWTNSIIQGRRGKDKPFISTKNSKIKLHQDGKQGRTSEFIATKMPRTLLSTVTAESPTAFLVRQEMRNWMMLQFEPSALRNPNSTYETKNSEITANGSNVPATLYRLAAEKNNDGIYQRLTNKLKELVPEVSAINIDRDEKRDLLTLQLSFKDGLNLPAQSLSDGTLRFLALGIIEEDNRGSGLICLEEPENGINPRKIEEMIILLEGMATDTSYPVDDDNPLRQVIINTHSPIVVKAVEADGLYLAKSEEVFIEKFNKKVKSTLFSSLKGTWRSNLKLSTTIKFGEISGYLGKTVSSSNSQSKSQETVIENLSTQYLLDFNE